MAEATTPTLRSLPECRLTLPAARLAAPRPRTQDRRDVQQLHRARRDAELLRDLLVGAAGDQEPRDLLLGGVRSARRGFGSSAGGAPRPRARRARRPGARGRRRDRALLLPARGRPRPAPRGAPPAPRSALRARSPCVDDEARRAGLGPIRPLSFATRSAASASTSRVTSMTRPSRPPRRPRAGSAGRCRAPVWTRPSAPMTRDL